MLLRTLLALFFATTLHAQSSRLEGVDARRDLPYAGTDNPRQKLDLYLPAKRADDKPLPIVVFIHGGGWQNGDKSGGTRFVIPLVQSGRYAGVSIGYRLSGEAKWPAQVHDCKAAIRWLRANAKEYNLDPDRIGVWGLSAGGHLVSLLGTSGDVKELEGTLGAFTGVSSRVTCVVNFFGPENFLTIIPPEAHERAIGAVGALFGGSIEQKRADAIAASPVTHVTSDDPPFLTAHGTKDPLVPYAQAQELDAALKKAGVSHLLMQMVDAGHGFQSAELNRRIAQFFELHLHGVQSEIATSPIGERAAQ